jgi:hypothetical protein
VNVRRASLLATCAVLALATTAYAAPGDFRTGTHPGYARLVFEFGRAAPPETIVEGNRLTIRFREVFPGTLGPAALRRVEDRLTGGRLSEDGRSVTFELRGPATVRGFVNDRSAVVDVIGAANPTPPSAATTPAAAVPTPAIAPAAASTPAIAPPPASLPPTGGPAVPVRVGRHPTYTRIVFDWPQPNPYRVATDAVGVRVDFERPGTVETDRLRRLLPPSIAGASASATPDGGLSIRLATVPDPQIRHFYNGAAVVVDVLVPPDRDPGPAARNAAVAPPPVTAEAAAQAQPANRAPADVATSLNAAPPPPPPPPVVAPLPTARPPLVANGTSGASAAVVAPVTVKVQPAQTPNGPRLRFPFTDLPPAAAFVRGEHAYVVFDRPVVLDIGDVARSPLRTLQPEVVPLRDGAALRLRVGQTINPRMTAEPEGWVATMLTEPRGPQTVFVVTADGTPGGGGRVTVNLRDGERVLQLPDPETNDLLQVVATRAQGNGVDGMREFAQFGLPPTAQGLVVQNLADGHRVSVGATGVVIGRLGGTLLSAPMLRPGGTLEGLFDFRRWLEPDVDFIETRQRLTRDAGAADPADPRGRSIGRFELAQFLIARDQAADAVGVLDLIAREDTARASDPALRALRGAARVMMGDGPAADRDFADPRLQADPALAIWRAAAHAQQERWSDADREFLAAGGLPVGLSPVMRQTFSLMRAEAAGHSGDLQRVRQAIDPLVRADTPAHIRVRAELVRAEALAKRGDRRAAYPILERLAQQEDEPRVRAHALFDLIEIGLLDKRITVDRAIEDLERLRFEWSGDRLQYRMLKRLGELQLERGDIRNGLARLREVLAFFPGHPDNDKVRQTMVDAFVALYDPQTRFPQPAYIALGLFDTYRDLVPDGPTGDRVVQNLAEKLVETDLLERASDLLEHQVRFRLTGAERARVGARLAFVRLEDRQPARALDALDLSAAPSPSLPPELVLDRDQFRARALIDLARVDEALRVLERDRTLNAERLRAEGYVRTRDWAKAADSFARLASAPATVSTDEKREQIMNLAVAQALARDAGGLARTAEQFAQTMKGSADEEAFVAVTRFPVTNGGPVGRGAPATVDLVNQRFDDLQRFQSFMKTHRDRFLRGGNGGGQTTQAPASRTPPG